jgi:hypothetical protein
MDKMAPPLATAHYAEQSKAWPLTGKHILAQFDDETIVVYQAYRPSIGRFAIEKGSFGGDFGYSRMSWIKPNFLWMMYRSQWGQAEGQEVVLAVRLKRHFFDSLLTRAVASSFDADVFASHDDWVAAVARSDVRLQWDPDHLPTGEKCERRAIQLGLRGAALEAYGKREIVEIIDMSAFVAEQRANWSSILPGLSETFGFRFWNWPPLSRSFVDRIVSILGHKVVIIGGKI